MEEKKSLKIGFVHPDLGIGGAERLVVDAAVGLKQTGHNIVMFTTYHDKKRCFQETRDGTLKVVTYGKFMPRNFFGFFHILFSIIRMCYCCLRIVLSWRKFDVFIVDQVSACIPILRLFTSAKILFYCHFPDKLLAIPPGTKGSLVKRMYRFPFDFIEESTTAMADQVLVNSKFTRRTFKRYFPKIKITPDVLYPTLNGESLDKEPISDSKMERLEKLFENKLAIVSINRFERKKDIGLAIKAFRYLESNLESSVFSKCLLVLAGGYDERLAENREYMKELEALLVGEGYDITDQTVFIKSFSASEKYVLLHKSACVVYTPQNEHFGIVPIEAQYCARPVVACNSGGPLESVEDSETGFLVDPNMEAFGEAVMKIVEDEGLRTRMGKAGRERVISMFTLDVFTKQLNKYVTELCE